MLGRVVLKFAGARVLADDVFAWVLLLAFEPLQRLWCLVP